MSEDDGRYESPALAGSDNFDHPCTLTIKRRSGSDVLLVAGVIDARARQALDDLSRQLISPLVAFDFRDVKRINSMGVALLLRCFKYLKDEKHAEIRLLNVNQVNAMLFRITGVLLLATLEESPYVGRLQ